MSGELSSDATLQGPRAVSVSLLVHLGPAPGSGGPMCYSGTEGRGVVIRPQEHAQRSTNGGDERSTAVTLLLSNFSSVDLQSTDVTLFT